MPSWLLLGYNAAVPPRVRQALFSRVFDNDDLLATLRKPLLVTHGADDGIVRQVAVDEITSVAAHAQRDIIPSAGHAPFWDDATAFNRRLATFCDAVSSATAAGRQAASPGCS